MYLYVCLEPGSVLPVIFPPQNGSRYSMQLWQKCSKYALSNVLHLDPWCSQTLYPAMCPHRKTKSGCCSKIIKEKQNYGAVWLLRGRGGQKSIACISCCFQFLKCTLNINFVCRGVLFTPKSYTSTWEIEKKKRILYRNEIIVFSFQPFQMCV